MDRDMLKIFTRQEAGEWLDECGITPKKHDPYTDNVSAAVSAGILMRVGDSHFTPARYESGKVVWFIDCVVEFPDSFMEKTGVTHRFRYMEHALHVPRGYKGARERSGEFDVDPKKSGKRGG